LEEILYWYSHNSLRILLFTAFALPLAVFFGILLSFHYKKKGIAITIVVLLLILAQCGILRYSIGFYDAQAHEALDQFIISVVQGEDLPDFEISEMSDWDRNDFDLSYQIKGTDALLGNWEFLVRFPNGNEYYISIVRPSDKWEVYLRRED
jgi:hypothetical protein